MGFGNFVVPPPPDLSSLPAYKDTSAPNASDLAIPPAPDLSGFPSSTGFDDRYAGQVPDVSSLSLTDNARVNSVLSVGAIPPQTVSIGGAGIQTAGKAGTPGHINTGTKYGYRHFTFVFKNEIDGNIVTLDLNINPEDLAVDTPYRVNTIQTMGGAFIDIWGEGIKRIIMRGHTGWRTVQMPAQKQDGYDNFTSLKELIFDKYHQVRSDGAKTYSTDELDKMVKLTLVDRLHNKAYTVVPEQFRALRNRQRPLLHMYEVSFVVQDKGDDTTLQQYSQNQDANLAGAFGELTAQGIGLQNKAGKAGKLQSLVQTLGKGIQKIGETMAQINKVKNTILNDVATVANKYNECIQLVRTGIGMVQSVTDLSTLSLIEKSILWDTKSVYRQAELLLDQVKSGGLFTYTGIVGTTYAPVPFSQGQIGPYGYGIGVPLIAQTTNSFEAMKSSTGSQLSSVSDSISLKSQSFQTKVNSFDLVGYMMGKK